jgi:acyl-coenzyme A thioesterase PaaI-like protein
MRQLDGSLFGPESPCFGCSPHNPSGFQLKFVDEGEEIVTRFTPGERHQSAPGLMHGGLVFTLADELAAWVLVARLGKFGFTTHFSGKMQRPVRPSIEVEGRARLAKSTSRTAAVEVTLRQEGEVAFQGAFTFVILDKGGAEKLMGQAMPEAWLKFSR